VHPRALVQRGIAISQRAASGIARQTLALCLLCEVLLRDLLIVLVKDVLGHALHAEDLDFEALAAGYGIFDVGEILLVDLVHVHREACVCEHERGRGEHGGAMG
jgi:hypothetical protein